MERIDFTKMRKGSRPWRGGGKIELCPECGRKGEYQRYLPKRDDLGSVIQASYSHVGFIDDLFGNGSRILRVEESCWVIESRVKLEVAK